MFSFSGASVALARHQHRHFCSAHFPVKPRVEATRKRATYVRADVRTPTNSLTDAQIMIRLLFECRSNEMLPKRAASPGQSFLERRDTCAHGGPAATHIYGISRSRVYMAVTGASAQATLHPR